MPEKVKELTDQIVNLNEYVKTLANQIGGLGKALNRTEDDTGSFAKEVTKARKELENLLKDRDKSIKSVSDALKSGNDAVKLAAKNYHDAVEAEREFDKAAKELIKEAKTLTDKIKEESAAFQKMSSIITGTVAGFIKLAGTVGVAAFSINDIAKAGLQYNTAMVSVLKTQNSMGAGLKNVDSTLEDLSKNTNLSKIAFAELSETINSSMAGVKMSLTDVSNLSQTFNNIGIIGAEAQKKKAQELIGIQSKFPSLYDDIIRAQKLVSDTAGGKGTQEDKEELDFLRKKIMMTQSLTGASVEQQNSIRSGLASVSAEQQKINQMSIEKAKADKAMQDAQLEFYTKLQPMIIGVLKTVTAIMNFSKSWIGITAILAATVLIVVGRYKKLKAEIREAAAWQAVLDALTGNLAFLAAGAVLAAAAIGYEIYENVKAAKEANKESKKQNEALKDSQLEQQKVNAEMDAMLGIIGKATEGYQTLVDTSEKFGLVNQTALNSLTEMAKESKKIAETGLKNALEGVKDRYNIKVNFDMDIGDQALDAVKQLEEKLSGLAGAGASADKERKAIQEEISNIMNYQKTVTQQSASIVQRQRDASMAEAKQVENVTSKYESRLDTQRKLYESAQFGLGASISMMQKQVDLAYKNLQTYEKTIAKRKEDVSFLSKYQREELENASSAAEAQDLITKKFGLRDEEARKANLYAEDYQDLSKKSMEQQQKIYDLTKNIREGYLDAIREMSVGAGEFEKIIGTQDMGVTQLMDTVDKFASGALNTMKLGGRQSAAETAAGVGVGVTGGFKAGGGPLAAFIPQAEQNRRNARIYGYNQDIATGKPGEKVGSGISAGAHPETIAAEREWVPHTKQEEIKTQAQATFEGVDRALKRNKGVMPGVNPINGGEQWRNDTGEFDASMPSLTKVAAFSKSVSEAAGKQAANANPGARPPSQITQPSQVLVQSQSTAQATGSVSGASPQVSTYTKKFKELQATQSDLQDAGKEYGDLIKEFRSTGEGDTLTRGDLKKKIAASYAKVTERGAAVGEAKRGLSRLDTQASAAKTPNNKLDEYQKQLEDSKKHQAEVAKRVEHAEKVKEALSKVSTFLLGGDKRKEAEATWDKELSNSKKELDLSDQAVDNAQEKVNTEKDSLLNARAVAEAKAKEASANAAVAKAAEAEGARMIKESDAAQAAAGAAATAEKEAMAAKAKAATELADEEASAKFHEEKEKAATDKAAAEKAGIDKRMKEYEQPSVAQASASWLHGGGGGFSGGGKNVKRMGGPLSSSFAGGAKNIKRMGQSKLYKEAVKELSKEASISSTAATTPDATGTGHAGYAMAAAQQKQEQSNAMAGKSATCGGADSGGLKVVLELHLKGGAQDLIHIVSKAVGSSNVKILSGS